MSKHDTNAGQIGVLMPAITNYERFHIRYGGLERELRDLGKEAIFAFSHDSYNPGTHSLEEVVDTKNTKIASSARPSVVRDLTMPKDDDRPIYTDRRAPTLVHNPEFSTLLRDKRNVYNLFPESHPQTLAASGREITEAATAICSELVVVKPVVGEQSKGVFIGKKRQIPDDMPDGYYLIQEFVDTSAGIEELGIQGVHNLRLLSINSELVGAVGRVNNAEGHNLRGLRDDIYGSVYLPEQLPDSMLQIVLAVQARFKNLPGDGHNVVAVDLMRGFNAQGDEIDVICEINRRPLRISAYDLKEPQRDPAGIAWLAREWDRQEARMLNSVAEGENHQ